MYYSHYISPIGTLLLIGDGEALHRISFPDAQEPAQLEHHWEHRADCFSALENQLDAYFDGSLQQFNIPLSQNGTEFQLSVWNALTRVEYGKTCSYQDIAKAIGKPTASRAVGSANGANPLPIIIPCHRVIGSNGTLTGFAGGLYTKQWLLSHEVGEISLFPFEEWLSPK